MLRRTNPPGRLAKLEQLVMLRERARARPSRVVMLSFLLVCLAGDSYWAHAAFEPYALNKPGMFLMTLMFCAQVSGELLYPGAAGRLLRVLARLVLLPMALAFFVAALYQDRGLRSPGGGIIFVSCLALLVRDWRASRARPGSGDGRAAPTPVRPPARTAPP